MPEDIKAENKEGKKQLSRRNFLVTGGTVVAVDALIATTPAKAVAGVLATPLQMVVGWLAVGVLAHAAARLLGGRAALSQTLGATSLATAPQMLGVVRVVPDVTTAGLGVWGLVCLYVAIKTAHELDTRRAFWATALATIVPFALLFLVAAAVAAASWSGGLRRVDAPEHADRQSRPTGCRDPSADTSAAHYRRSAGAR